MSRTCVLLGSFSRVLTNESVNKVAEFLNHNYDTLICRSDGSNSYKRIVDQFDHYTVGFYRECSQTRCHYQSQIKTKGHIWLMELIDATDVYDFVFIRDMIGETTQEELDIVKCMKRRAVILSYDTIEWMNGGDHE